jgi:hypothetical protein
MAGIPDLPTTFCKHLSAELVWSLYVTKEVECVAEPNLSVFVWRNIILYAQKAYSIDRLFNCFEDETPRKEVEHALMEMGTAAAAAINRWKNGDIVMC